MQIETEVKKWGNSLALRITGIMAELPGFSEGTRVVVDVSEDGIVVKRLARKQHNFRFPYSESDLLSDLTAESIHADELAQPSGIELGE
jgi:antitoxin MazE